MNRVGQPAEVGVGGQLPDVGCGFVHHAPGDRRQRRDDLMKRVVITGMGGVTALGDQLGRDRDRACRRGAQRRAAHDRVGLLRVAAYAARVPAARLRRPGALSAQEDALDGPRVALFGARERTRARRRGPAGDASIADGRMGVAYGSSSGSVEPIRAFGTMLATGSMSDVTSNSYVQMMPHTTRGQRQPLLGPEGPDRADVAARARRAARRSATPTRRSRPASRR